MLKTIDKFVLKRFFGPFFLTFAVVLFILLLVNILRYFKDFVGKDLGIMVFVEFFSYFSLVTTPVALPLAVLLASLMSFGGLGQHSELTAIKGAGISLIRILVPVGVLVFFITLAAVYFNETISPKANLKAYSLLYDIRQKKPTLAFNPGEFYNGLPGFSLKIEGKSGENGEMLEGVMIYNHSAKKGNTDLIMADNGKMFTMGKEDEYLVLDLFHGASYAELTGSQASGQARTEYTRSEFDTSRLVFSLASFGLKKTKEELFKGHNMMKTTTQLEQERDSVIKTSSDIIADLPRRVKGYHQYQFATDNKIYRERERKEQEERMKQLQENKKQPTKDYSLNTDTTTIEPEKEILPERPEVQLSAAKQKPIIDDLMKHRKKRISDEARRKVDFARRNMTRNRKDTPVLPTPDKGKAEGNPNPNLPNQLEPVDNGGKPSVTNTGTVRTPPTPNPNAKNNTGVLEEAEFVEEGGIEETIVEVKEEVKESESLLDQPVSQRGLNLAWSKANGIRSAVDDVLKRRERDERRIADYQIDIYMKLAQSVAVFVMFLIGAPLGAIIKKGGLGIPVLISIVFFVIYYISTMMGKKYAEEMVISPIVGCWGGIVLLFFIGLFCLRQAYADARLFDFDYYVVLFNRGKNKLLGKKTA